MIADGAQALSTMKRGLNGMKTPVVRSLPALLTVSPAHAPTPITLCILDMQRGYDRHSVSFSLPSSGGDELLVTGTVSGVTFHPVERRGAPKKLGRDLAILMAQEMFLRTGSKPPLARRQVLDMWDVRGWQGLPDDSALGRRLKAGRLVVDQAGSSVFICACVGDGPDQLVAFIASPEAFDARPGRHTRGGGVGWYWRNGDESARYGRFRFESD